MSAEDSLIPPLKKFIQIWRSEDMVKYVLTALEKYVKRDNITKMSVFFTGLSAYLAEPINLFLKGESSIGKTYNTVQSLQHFPKSDVWFLGGMSPKNLVHEHGIRLTKDGKPLDSIEKPVKPNRKEFEDDRSYELALKEYKDELREYQKQVNESYTLVDMSNKILVFLEAPDLETFRMLLPILSHDKDEIEYRFVDKTTKGMRSQRVVIKGWPATIFLTTDRSYLEDLATRSFTATPESSKEKIEEAHKLINDMMSFPWKHAETEEDLCIKTLIRSIKGFVSDAVTSSNVLDVVIPFPNLHEPFPKQIVRDMRDFQHFCQFIKPIALLHAFQRPRMEINNKKYVIATFADVWNAVQIYSSIFETTRTGSEERIIKLYHEVLVKRGVWYIREIVDEWNKISPKKVSRDWVEKALKRLIELGYADSEPDPEDKRRIIYRPINASEIAEIYRKFSSRQFFEEILKKGAQDWIKKIADENLKVYIEKNSERVELSKEDLLSAIMSEKYFAIHPDGVLSAILNYPKFTEKSPIGEKNIRNSDYRQVSDISTISPTVTPESAAQHIPEIRRLKVEECFPGKCSYCGAQDVIEAYADGFGICGKCLKELEEKIKSLAPRDQSLSTPTPEPKPSAEERCINCKYWQGSEVTQIAYCAMFETSTPQTYSCGKWERRE
jgi:hypothetical protein